MPQHRRISVYGVCRSASRAVALLPAVGRPADHDRWTLPGGDVEHGEHPAAAVIRVMAEATGLVVDVERIQDVLIDLEAEPDGQTMWHRDCLIFEVRCADADADADADAGPGGLMSVAGAWSAASDRTWAWVEPDGIESSALEPVAARALGLIPTPLPAQALGLIPTPLPAGDEGAGAVANRVVLPRRQRFAAYGLVTDGAGRVLLTLISDGYPGAGWWHLPGGGTDFAEAAADGLLRELIEETDQRGRITGLLGVSHRQATVVPEGQSTGLHSVRVVFRAVVDQPTTPRVVEAPGGSTSAAAWVSPQEAAGLALTDIARDTIEKYLCAS